MERRSRLEWLTLSKMSITVQGKIETLTIMAKDELYVASKLAKVAEDGKFSIVSFGGGGVATLPVLLS
eukprot:8196629-Ditylum_brightwellii.AAC.1